MLKLFNGNAWHRKKCIRFSAIRTRYYHQLTLLGILILRCHHYFHTLFFYAGNSTEVVYLLNDCRSHVLFRKGNPVTLTLTLVMHVSLMSMLRKRESTLFLSRFSNKKRLLSFPRQPVVFFNINPYTSNNYRSCISSNSRSRLGPSGDYYSLHFHVKQWPRRML